MKVKIFKNIIPMIKLYDSLRHLSDTNREITKAREAGDFVREREQILKATSTWGLHIVKIYDINLNVKGKENLPEAGPVVFVANHQGFADIPVACAVLDKFQFAFVARENLERLPSFGPWIRHIRSVFMKREDVRSSLRTIDEGIALLEKGYSLLIFPEGTRTKGDHILEFKKGSLRLATKPGVPIVPVTLRGTYRVFEESGYIKNGAQVDVIIHPAIETKGMDRSAVNGLTAEVEEIIKKGGVSL